jgi:pyruvate kinase
MKKRRKTMAFSANKTKIVCTVGPATDTQEILEDMIYAGMNVVRLNFSHGEFAGHKDKIEKIRAASRATGRRVAIMADLPGPKMRIGKLEPEPIELKPGAFLTLTTDDLVGNIDRISASFAGLPQRVKPSDKLFLNDGFIQIEVMRVEGKDVQCKVVVGGELRSRKGLNLPGIDLGIRAFTEHDHDCLKFALEQGVDAVSQSFVESGEDIRLVRDAAQKMGHRPFIIAKIERSRALDNLEEILNTADAIMIARGDLGVEIPIEEIAVVQKQIIYQANLKGKPVITATQMLESMTASRLPTRAEATDVANAILDGTDCVMLSGESAMGKYPVESVAMLARIAAVIEKHRPSHRLRETLTDTGDSTDIRLQDLIALSVENVLRHITPAAVVIPTRSGATARSIARYRPHAWITAVSSEESTCQNLMFSYGVFPVHVSEHPANWKPLIKEKLRSVGVKGNLVVLTEGPSRQHPDTDNRMEILDLNR